ncbi:MAG TPA: LLM class flavin-dependent oxidoreductase [Acidimicrobiia bacterium]
MEIALQKRGTYEETLAFARWCESNGIGCLALADHYLSGERHLPALDSLVALGGLVRETTVLDFASLVSPVTFRHPAVHLKTAATLAEMSGGRFALGIGTGWWEEEHTLFGLPFFDRRERFARTEETLAYLTSHFRGDGFEGRYYRLEPFESAPSAVVPLIVGGSGPTRTPELAGRYADEFNAYPSATGDLAERIYRCRQVAADSGRDPDRILISSAFPVVAGTTKSAYRTALAAAASDSGRTAEDIEETYAKRGIPHGSREQVQEGLAAMSSAGVTRVYLQLGRTGIDGVADLVEAFRG